MYNYPGSLHNHSDYSNFRLRDSINRIEALIDRAIELGHSTIAITEHETIASSIKVEKYYNKIKKDYPDFKVIRGNEIYLCRDGLNLENFNKENDKFYHFILLAKDKKGHEQIRELSTRAWMNSFTYKKMTRVPTYYRDLIEIIGKEPGHVIGSTACLGGALPTQLLKYRDTKNDALYEKIKIWCRQLQNIFGEDNFFLEMQPSFNEEQIYVNNELIKLSEELKIPFIITTDSHYLSKQDRPIHKAYLKSKDGDREVDSFYATTYLMDTKEIYHYMEKYIGEENLKKAFDNIINISNSCEDFSIMSPLKIPRLDWKQPKPVKELDYWLKNIPAFNNFMYSSYEEDRILALILMNKLEEDENYRTEETYKEINACLEDTWVSSEVNGSRWSAYFLNLQNIIDICWEAGTLVGAGRGSGVGFILLNMLDITQINPLKEKTATYRWRFLNPERVSVLDVDVDIEGGRRAKVLSSFRQYYGNERVANVLTLGTEKSKAAILTAARGLGIDIDIAQYLSSFIVADRGQTRTLKQTFYGDEENDMLPNKQFRFEMENNYPELWEVAQYIEGLVCRVGIHAGGVIFVDEPFTKSCALMKAPSGEIITQLDLHDAEEVGLIKYDILSIEALDKIHNTLDLLIEQKYIEPKDTLKETYEEVIGIYTLDRDSQKMWEMCWNHEIMSLFQMEKQSGIQGIAAMNPTSVDDLAILNSAIRLMAQEKGMEIPVQKLARFKKYPQDWDSELASYGLTKEDKKILEPVVGISYGLCIAQEQFMQLVQLPQLGGFDLTWADKLRKSIAKKNPAEYDRLTEEFFRVTKEKGCNQNLCKYVWNVLIAMSRGYGFNQSHTLAYSLIALQEMNLAYKYPIIFWNCGCLISDSGGADISNLEEDEEIDKPEESIWIEMSDIENFDNEDDNEEEEDEEIVIVKKADKKKKNKTADFGKIASAIGKMKSVGVEIQPPDINRSNFTFSPDAENNIIRYGLSGITRVGEDLVHNIMNNRPYSSIEDFLSKIKINKPQMVNLIKSGAFDSFGNRKEIMRKYIDMISDKKKRLTLQNMQMLINYKMLPDSLEFEVRVYNFNKYLKKFKDGTDYLLNEISFNFFEKNYDVDLLRVDGDYYRIKQAVWDKKYQAAMDPVRNYIKANTTELLTELNNKLFNEMWDKYCLGSISKWEMDAVSCYFHHHELEHINNFKYQLSDYFELPENPEIDRIVPMNGRDVPLYKIKRIAGTVLDKDKAKKNITLLTTEGVVTVKIYGDVYNHYDKQISEKDPITGKKKVLEKSIFSRGNKVIITGIRRENEFLAKKYKNTPYHLVELITSIKDNGDLITQEKRYGEE